MKKTYLLIIILVALTVMVFSLVFGWYKKENPALNHDMVFDELGVAMNVKLISDVQYGKGAPNSEMDIIMPKKIKAGDKLPLIIWTHGGGYIAGDKKHKNAYLARIAERGFIIANMNYALAPAHQYPVPLIQEKQAAQFMKRNTFHLPIDFNQIIIGGDSAGAQIAAQFAALQTNELLRKEMQEEAVFTPDDIKGVILFGGLYDMDTVRATKFPRIEDFMESYTGEKYWERDFKQIDQMSITQQVTGKYPPTFLTVGDADPFESQAKELLKVLQENQVPTSTSFFDGSHRLRHQYQFHMNLKESQITYDKVIKFLSTFTDQPLYNTLEEEPLTTKTK
ncbi:alpha/beta hydrolase [Macrococcoides caseolyticum]|uniref:Lipase n=1 Tax=Macrococcoides caseolyticum TaxID=69966 RepID=A0A855GIV9_9STAP|nr:alpha/beta hydrolase [Macrococcus caseolyticus]PKE25804.1 lipase [Macrococcus caseolyticus]PKE58318.1 lipase [Macrococcus caseolyticus]PKE70709.1 lipase [Macrococcus caseolyticus]UTH05043.1 alpha/beta hydrolase [Macrococcus caseolyticus]